MSTTKITFPFQAILEYELALIIYHTAYDIIIDIPDEVVCYYNI
jgi:hypothetical protein